jgi:hypothetical protein
MFKRDLIAAAVALAFAGAAQGQDAELAKIREEIKQMKDGYEQRIQSLEKRLAEAEAKAGKAEATAEKAETAAAASQSRPATESTFNPAISLILQGTYARTTQDPNTYRITGFMPSGGEVGPPKRSFGLGETELTFSASIDPYFRGVAIASLTPENEVEVEEAYFQTLALPQGFTLKGGRFLSGIGYQNEIHQHAWDFQDAPLAYKAFLGGRLRQDGVQLRWLAPTPIFLELGAELSSGDQFPGSDRNKNGVGGSSLFGHVGGDIGPSYAWRAGLSYLRTRPQNRAYDDLDALGNTVTNSFTGRARMWIADAVLKWAPGGNATHTNFKLQGEYFRFKQDGSLTYDDSGQAVPQFGVPFSDSFNSEQSGWYGQGVWQFMPRWRVGYRYDRLRHGTINNGIVDNALGPTAADFSLLANHSPTRNTVMLDFSPTEFSRLRLQLARDQSRFGVTDNQLMLQYIHSLGPHGAHKF